MTADKMAFEIHYGDDSGVQYAARLDLTGDNMEDGSGVVQFEAIGQTVEFPVSRLDWLMDALERFHDEVNP